MAVITKRFADSLFPGPREAEYWGEKIPGFDIRIKPSGVKSYVIRYRTTSWQRRLTLGQTREDYPRPSPPNGEGPLL